MGKEDVVDVFQKQLYEASRHCKVSLLYYVDELKRLARDDAEKGRWERIKREVHTDVAQFYQTASNLLELRKTGGQIIPFGRINADKGSGRNHTPRKGDTREAKKKTTESSSPKPEGSG